MLLKGVFKCENIISKEMEKYKKLREIGQGSFGRVALVQEKKGKGRKLVLKEVEIKRMAEGEQEKVRIKGNLFHLFFSAEQGDARSEAALRVGPPTCCPVYRVLHRGRLRTHGEQNRFGSLDCQVMEFCEAGDLFTLITNQRGKPLQEELILFFFLQVVCFK